MSKHHPQFLPRLLKAGHAAIYLGMSETKFRLLVNSGTISRPKRQGGNVSWDIRDLDAFVDDLPRDGEPANDDWAGVAL